MPGRLLVFTRYPEPGRTKTRLIPALGAERAAAVHRSLATHTLRADEEFRCDHDAIVEVWFAGGDTSAMRALFGERLIYQPQSDGDLGRRILTALESPAGFPPTIIIGTDCPDLSAERIARAFAALREHDVVLGPALDGGYYLIGLRSPCPALFQDIPWGTAEVFERTTEIAAREQRSVARLEPLPDVDEPSDLIHWRRAVGEVAATITRGMISVIVPTLNEESELSRTLMPLAMQTELELIVVDGGSTDATCAAAVQSGARVLHSVPGRGVQMNVGARSAQGEHLLFLHADTQLPEDFAAHVRSTLGAPGVAGGAFQLHIDAPHRSFRMIEQAVKFRSRRLQRPYGDQALFLNRNTFDQVGGFPEWPLMEDVELVRRLRRHGRIVIAASSVLTSARRWQRLGVARTTCLNQFLLWAHYFGVSPHRLARWYRGSDRPTDGNGV